MFEGFTPSRTIAAARSVAPRLLTALLAVLLLFGTLAVVPGDVAYGDGGSDGGAASVTTTTVPDTTTTSVADTTTTTSVADTTTTSVADTTSTTSVADTTSTTVAGEDDPAAAAITEGEDSAETDDAASAAPEQTEAAARTFEPLDTVVVPNVVGQDEWTARYTIRDAALNMGQITYEYDDTVPAGQVISQNPAAGTSVEEHSDVDFVTARPTPVINPAWPNKCGGKIAMVLDASKSMVSSTSPDPGYKLKEAAKSFVDVMSNTPSQIGVTWFAGISRDEGYPGVGGLSINLTDVSGGPNSQGALAVEAAIDNTSIPTSVPRGGGDELGEGLPDGRHVERHARRGAVPHRRQPDPVQRRSQLQWDRH